MIRGKTIQGFGRDLRKFADTIEVDFIKVKKKVAFDLFGKIVQRTPVLTGRARANWGVSEGYIPANLLPPFQQSLSPAQATQHAKQNVNALFLDPWAVIWIYNNLDYIVELEKGRSGKAPYGMVAVSLAEIDTELAMAVNHAV